MMCAGPSMDHGYSALDDGTRRGLRPGGPRERGRPVAPHHRRRRVVAALVGLATLALISGIAVGAGASGSGTSAHRATVLPDGYLSRIRTLAGGGAGSFVVGEQRAENDAINRTL